MSRIRSASYSIDEFPLQEVKEWRKELRNLLDQFHRDLEFRNNVTANFDVIYSNHYATQRQLKSVETMMEEIKTKNTDDAATKEQNFNTRTDQCERCIVLERKVSEALVEVRQMKNIVCETEDKYDKIENVSSVVRKMSAETKQELTDLVEHLKMEKKLKTFVNCEGHLIWRVDGYKARLKNARENDIIIKSPIFCDRLYGYSLRMDLLLDGFGTWKGRNILACVTVIPGEWDSLLSWPCRLNTDIILRDQTDDITMVISNISAYIVGQIALMTQNNNNGFSSGKKHFESGHSEKTRCQLQSPAIHLYST